uniref:Uncharacterized protein n=1 Tax=Anguilla anguilla TaxID=7936 RepID=A0A0E9SWD1_ANGAN
MIYLQFIHAGPLDQNRSSQESRGIPRPIKPDLRASLMTI